MKRDEGPKDWPLYMEIQAAKAWLKRAGSWEEQMAALKEVDRLCRQRNALIEDMDVIAEAGEELVA